MPSTHSLPLLLKELRLTEIAKAWPALANKATKEAWEPELFLAELCELEVNHRYENRLKRLLKESKLPTGKQLSQYDFGEITGVTAQQLKQKVSQLE
jgi:DNA replication protein DnaC